MRFLYLNYLLKIEEKFNRNFVFLFFSGLGTKKHLHLNYTLLIERLSWKLIFNYFFFSK